MTIPLSKVSLTEAVLQATVERQLEKSGIKVIPEEASERPETEGILNVRVKFLDPEPPKKTLSCFNRNLARCGLLNLWQG